ncbi:hypothetical protein CTM53_02985 [Prevotella intermedia]|uniref:Uncharacterized protein n=1 Tax=Prevotella intermedia TaxID=28131 RepID=A0AAJ3RSB3_PREIN|nr:hypothetical protein CTM53_02985 [Prevotella intermedia]
MYNHLVINALQNLLFCIPKAAVLHGKSVGFAAQKSRFRNVKAQLSLFNTIFFTKKEIIKDGLFIKGVIRNLCKIRSRQNTITGN